MIIILVASSGIFPREQVTASNRKSLELVLQFLQFQAMLLCAKALCYSLCLNFSNQSFNLFNVTPRAPITIGTTTA